MNRDIHIRVARESDAAALRDIYAPYVERTAVSFEYEAPDVATFAGRIRRVQERYPYLVAKSDGELLGYAYAGSFHSREAYSWSAEASIYLRMDCRRMGVGSALYRALEAALKAMGVRNLYACIAVPDAPDEYLTLDSMRFHAAMGYRTVGEFHHCGWKFGRWYSMVWMEKLLDPDPSAPSPLKSFRELNANTIPGIKSGR
ncbi:MAG: GNAT family N-acetyltransferase [Aristaeellaceae bacterium]